MAAHKKNFCGITTIGKFIVSSDVGTSIAHPCEMSIIILDKPLHYNTDLLTLFLYLLVVKISSGLKFNLRHSD